LPLDDHNSKNKEEGKKYIINEWKKVEIEHDKYEECLFYVKNKGYICFKTTKYAEILEKLFICKNKFYKKNDCLSKYLLKTEINITNGLKTYGESQIFHNGMEHLELCEVKPKKF